MTARPDPLIHPITRLSICGLLAAGADWVEFAALRDAAGISDSVLSKQSRVLEDAGYVEVRKGAVGRRPRTWFRLTPKGRQAVQGHLAWLAQLEEAFSASTRDARQARPLPGDHDEAHQGRLSPVTDRIARRPPGLSGSPRSAWSRS